MDLAAEAGSGEASVEAEDGGEVDSFHFQVMLIHGLILMGIHSRMGIIIPME
jgi:hypothetical protein